MRDLGDGYVELGWSPVVDASYNVYRSPLAGGGWVRVNDEPVADATYRDDGLENGRLYHYVVTAVDGVGNESAYSNEAAETPRLSIETANLAGPTTLTHTISALAATPAICAEATITGRTGPSGPVASLRAELGFGPAGSDPQADPTWLWGPAAYAGAVGAADRFCATLLPEQIGSFAYAFRLTTSNGRLWDHVGMGALEVLPSADTTAPAPPSGVTVISATPEGIELAWDQGVDRADLFAYEVLRADEFDPKNTFVGRTTASTFIDTDVVEGVTYSYEIVAIDTSFNRSAQSAPVEARAAPRLVSIVFNVSVPPPSGAAVDADVHIAGTLSGLDGDHPDWDPAATVLDRPIVATAHSAHAAAGNRPAGGSEAVSGAAALRDRRARRCAPPCRPPCRAPRRRSCGSARWRGGPRRGRRGPRGRGPRRPAPRQPPVMCRITGTNSCVGEKSTYAQSVSATGAWPGMGRWEGM